MQDGFAVDDDGTDGHLCLLLVIMTAKKKPPRNDPGRLLG
ncbi:hypothetical protein FM101_08235 [Arthrobacter rhombi]|uniref:Uncharacterized protein n=1 Tax=Arthrobacter rhombi TaxID=71253 RepID=A0A1R4G710_9MICC|nr:hypothetical protein FM101_08235 [Arthrobacter rhombi]